MAVERYQIRHSECIGVDRHDAGDAGPFCGNRDCWGVSPAWELRCNVSDDGRSSYGAVRFFDKGRDQPDDVFGYFLHQFTENDKFMFTADNPQFQAGALLR